MQISVKSNASAVAKAMDVFGKQQMPFATSLALNDAAFAVRKEIVERTYPDSFTVRNKRFAGAMFRVGKASSVSVATVSDVSGRDYMAMQAEGGIKRPRGRNIAIPSRRLSARLQARCRWQSTAQRAWGQRLPHNASQRSACHC